VFNTVGVNSPTIPVQPPRAAPKNAPPLTFSVPATTGQGNGAAAASSTELPGVFYFGAEYCPYCAAERWPLIIALSRFGKFANLGTMESSAQDIDASTATFTFLRASLASPYVAFKAVEHQSNQIVGGSYSILQPLNAAEAKLVAKYDNSPSTASSAASSGSYPFVDFGNKWLTVGASYSPTALAGLTREQIASGLSDPTQPVTQAIISTANYQTAAICQITQDQPSSVCTSKGVTEAAKAMGIKS